MHIDFYYLDKPCANTKYIYVLLMFLFISYNV